MYIKSKYSQTVVKDYAINSSDTSRAENLWIQIINGKTKYIIGGIYRHPSGSLTEFSNNLEETMCKVSKCNVPYIIAGDININLLNCSTDKHTDEYMKNVLLHACDCYAYTHHIPQCNIN